jgi:Ni,Fe-hydrogenase III large subunit
MTRRPSYACFRLRAIAGILWRQTLSRFSRRLPRSPGFYATPREGFEQIRTLVATVNRGFPPLVELYDNTASLQDRTVGTGIVHPALARQYGCGGYIGRASGRAFDARLQLAYPPYDALLFNYDVPLLTEGDVNARIWIRIREVAQSLALVELILARIPVQGPTRVAVSKTGNGA